MKANIRRDIIAEIKRRKITTNQLAVLVSGRIHRSHIYDYIAGRKDLTTEKANYILMALGLKIIAEDAPSPRKQ